MPFIIMRLPRWYARSQGQNRLRPVQSWFAPEARVEPGEGGKIWVSWGPECAGESRIEALEPERILRQTQGRGSGRDPSVVEFTIEARDGGHTTLRLVNSAFGDDASFDAELETTSHAWGQFVYLLKHGAERAYKTCRNVSILRMISMQHREVLLRLSAPLKGEQRYWDPFGQACYEIDDSLIAIFSEPAGEATMVTTMALVYDADDTREQASRELLEGLFENIETTAASGA